jgi:hypothetical protein
MEELITNLHIHTTYSDGSCIHAEIAQTALNAGLDAVIITDHNVLVKGLEGYFQKDGHKLLLLVGEEINDRLREPAKNHLLVLGAQRELSTYANDPQLLIDRASNAGAVTFIAHPYEDEMPFLHELAYEWVDWQVTGFTGLEIWNGFSELKSVSHSALENLFYAFFPEFIAHSPLRRTMQKWDELISQGKKIVAIGGSDSHALKMKAGPFTRTIFPYDYHFHSINTHLVVPNQLSGDIENDRKLILDALRQGHAFVANDLPAATRGFRFTAQGRDKTAIMGDDINLFGSVTLQIRMPLAAECFLIKDGKVTKALKNRNSYTQVITQPGVYRVECYLDYLGSRRGWIYSNPIYVHLPEAPSKQMN